MEYISKSYRYYLKKEQYHREYYQLNKERIKQYAKTYYHNKKSIYKLYPITISSHFIG